MPASCQSTTGAYVAALLLLASVAVLRVLSLQAVSEPSRSADHPPRASRNVSADVANVTGLSAARNGSDTEAVRTVHLSSKKKPEQGLS